MFSGSSYCTDVKMKGKEGRERTNETKGSKKKKTFAPEENYCPERAKSVKGADIFLQTLQREDCIPSARLPAISRSLSWLEQWR
jgi:hypothetical protein